MVGTRILDTSVFDMGEDVIVENCSSLTEYTVAIGEDGDKLRTACIVGNEAINRTIKSSEQAIANAKKEFESSIDQIIFHGGG